MRERSTRADRDAALDLSLRRDLPRTRGQVSEELIASTLAGLVERERPDRGRKLRRRGLALAAGLLPLALGALWFGGRDQASTAPSPPATLVAVAEEPDWLAPQELLARLERGAEVEGRRLANDLQRMQAAIWGDLPLGLRLEGVLLNRKR